MTMAMMIEHYHLNAPPNITINRAVDRAFEKCCHFIDDTKNVLIYGTPSQWPGVAIGVPHILSLGDADNEAYFLTMIQNNLEKEYALDGEWAFIDLSFKGAPGSRKLVIRRPPRYFKIEQDLAFVTAGCLDFIEKNSLHHAYGTTPPESKILVPTVAHGNASDESYFLDLVRERMEELYPDGEWSFFKFTFEGSKNSRTLVVRRGPLILSY
jgi:hypothetical protein